MKTILLFLASSLAALAAEPDLTGKLGEYLETTRVKGASVLWISDGETSSWQHGFADADANRPVTPDTRFRAGSLSKLATATLTLRAAEQGLLSLGDPLEEWLPGILSGPKEWQENVTLAQILEHTAGLPGSSYAEYAASAPGLSPMDYVRQNAPFKLRWEPGVHYSYANPGATIIGAILEKAYDLPFDEIATNQLFQPLGMDSSDFSNTAGPPDALSATFDAAGNEILSLWQMSIRPSGSLVSTQADLEKLMRMLLAEGKLADGSSFLSPESVKRMETATTSLAAKHGATEGAYGLGNFGFVQNGAIFRGHWGRTDGFQTNFGYLPGRNSGFIIMLNSADRSAAHGLRKILAGALLGEVPETKPIPMAELSTPLSGTYVNFSHDMPMRTWLFALMESKRIETSPTGVTVSPLFHHGPSQNWTEISPNLYQADGVPVPTSIFDTRGGKDFWIDGESFVRRNAALIYGELFIILLAVLAAILAVLSAPVFLGLKKTRNARIAAAGLFVAAVSLPLLGWLFWEYGIMGMGGELGSITAVSICLLATSILLLLGSATALFMRRSPIFLRILATPLLLVSILFAIHGWVPLITFAS